MGRRITKQASKRNWEYDRVFTKSDKRVKRKKAREQVKELKRKEKEEAREEARKAKEQKKAKKIKKAPKKEEKVFKSYKDFNEEYMKMLLKANLKKTPRAYKVTFKNNPSLVYISFKAQRKSALWEACEYFKNNMHPDFLVDFIKMLSSSRGYRIQNLDKYAQEGRAPIPELLKNAKITLPCSVCGKYSFTYEDYIHDKCFIVEGEGDMLPYTKGYILCYHCFKRHIGTLE